MRRKILIAVLTAVGGGALAVTGFLPQTLRVADSEPDTTSPNWKQLSQDVGMLIRRDEGLGLRGRLFVRVNNAWVPRGKVILAIECR